MLNYSAYGVAPAADIDVTVAFRKAPAVANLTVADIAVGFTGLTVGI